MAFQPRVGETIEIDGQAFRIAQHPAARDMPYGQEGRAGTVYQLEVAAGGNGHWGGDPGHRALKVFKSRYRIPALVSLTEHLENFADLPGLEVCQRAVLTPQRHSAVLHGEPDLTYAVLMPWISGPTWMEVMLEGRELSPEQGLSLARSLVELLSTMEQRGLAHCDLSGPNVLLPGLVNGADPSLPPVALVDVEQLFGPGLSRPEVLTSGSPGYAQHRGMPSDVWESRADRFAGAVLIAEMLTWCDSRIREAAWGETYFDADETQEPSERYALLLNVLRERWGASVASLLERAWQSEVLADCPTFGEWMVALPESTEGSRQSHLPEQSHSTSSTAPPSASPEPRSPDEIVAGLMTVARHLEDQGNPVAALEVYEQARQQSAEGTGLRQELELIVQQLKLESAQPKASPAGPPPTASPQAPTDAAAFLADGTSAFERGEWGRARELLGEAIRWLPEKSKEKQRAQRMITTAERRLAPPRKPLPWKLITLALLLLGASATGAYAYQAHLANEAILLEAAHATATAQALATQQADAEAQALELARQQAAAAATATAQALAARVTATPLPTSTPVPTPTVDALWLNTLSMLDPVWEKDWPRSIDVLENFLRQFGGYRPAQEKLYGALVAYAEQLISQDRDEDAVKRLEQARALLPDRDEAEAALLSLTPTPTSVPAVTNPVRPSAPAAPVRPPAPVATKSPLAPR